MEDSLKNYWILVCNSSRYNIHELFKTEGSCLWNRRRNFAVGDIVYIYEARPVSKLVYKSIVDRINIERDKPESGDKFYTREYSKEYSVSLTHVATNTTNRLQYKELLNDFGISSMKLMRIPKIVDNNFIAYVEDVFAGKLADIPTPPTKEELYQPLPSGSIIEQIQYKMNFCELRDSHIAQKCGISSTTINRIRKGCTAKSEYIMDVMKALNLAFVEIGKESQIISPDEMPIIIKDKICNAGIRATEIAKICDASPSVISHLKNSGVLPKFEVFEKLINYYNFKLIKDVTHSSN